MIETKNIINFEDKAHIDISPLYFSISYPRTEDDMKYLRTEEEITKIIDEFDDVYYNHYEYQRKWLRKSSKSIYYIYDLSTGEQFAHTLTSKGDICNEHKWNNRRIITTLNKKKASDYIYEESIIDGILVFRFYCFSPHFIDEENKVQGYYETHRISYQDGEFWFENRETVSLFKMGRNSVYKYKYRLLKRIDFYENFPWLYLSPILPSDNIAREIHTMRDHIIPVDEYGYTKKFSSKDIKVKDIENYKHLKLTFCEFYSLMKSMPEGKGLNKNTPKDIVEHVTNDIPCKNTRTRKSLENKIAKNSLVEYGKFFFTPGDIIIESITEDLALLRLYIRDIECFRIYFTKDKIYKFYFDFKNFIWSSSKIRNKIMFRKVSLIKCQLSENDKTILNRIPLNMINMRNCLYYIELIPKYVFLEQLSKMGEGHLVDDLIYEYGEDGLMGFLYDDKYKKMRKSESITNILNFKPKNLKYLKGISWKSFIQINKNFKRIRKQYFDDDEMLAFKMLSCCNYELSTIKMIKKIYKEDTIHFFRTIVKRENSERELSIYLDYLKMIPDANKLQRHVFVEKIKPKDINIYHKRVTTDYNDYRKIKSQLENARFDEKFKKVINQKEYKQFLFENDNFKIIGPTCPFDLTLEGDKLHHCVGSYRASMANNNSFIYFIRKADDEETPYYTMEIVPTRTTLKSGKTKWSFVISQVYGEYDKYIDTEELDTFIKEFQKKHSRKLKSRF